MRIRYVLGLLLFCFPPTLRAQAACPSLDAGSTVRLHAPSPATYTLTEAVSPGDTVIAVPSRRAAGPMTIRCEYLERVEVRMGRVSRGRSALMGAGVGLLMGGVFGAGLGGMDGENQASELQLFSAHDKMLLGAAFVGSIGAASGGVIGFLLPGSRWRNVPLARQAPRASAEGLRVAPAGRAGVRVSYTLPL